MTHGTLVEYGRLGHVGRFASAAGLAPARGTAVVVSGPRGVELGRSLGPAEAFARSLDPAAGGELVRAATAGDVARADQFDRLAAEILAAAAGSAADLPVAVLDCEALFGGGVVLHVLPWDVCDCDPWAAALGARFGVPVRVLDVSPPPAAVAKPGCETCGSDGGGCGSAGGCSTGGCSRKVVKSAADMTAYFAGLRTQMEASSRVPLS